MKKSDLERLVVIDKEIEKLSLSIRQQLQTEKFDVRRAIETARKLDKLNDEIDQIKDNYLQKDYESSCVATSERVDKIRELWIEIGAEVLDKGGLKAYNRMLHPSPLEKIDKDIKHYQLKNYAEGNPISRAKERVYEQFQVAGVSYRKSEARAFCLAASKEVAFEHEPKNLYDKNAIKVIGIWKGLFWKKHHHIGYIPKEVSARLFGGGFLHLVRPRLMRTYIGDGGYVEITMQVVGLVEDFPTYRKFCDSIQE